MAEGEWSDLLRLAASANTEAGAEWSIDIALPRSVDGARQRWSDSKGVLVEERLSAAFAEIERRIPEDDRLVEERRLAILAREDEERRRVEFRRLALIEETRGQQLAGELEAWREASDIREYVERLRLSAVDASNETRKTVDDWCAWALERADRLDPTLHLDRIRPLHPD